MRTNKFERTIAILILFCIFTAVIFFYIRVSYSDKEMHCSYIDPITIDLIAFLAASFLFFEGIYRIIEHREDSVNRQLTRVIRIASGFAIMVIHFIYFIYK